MGRAFLSSFGVSSSSPEYSLFLNPAVLHLELIEDYKGSLCCQDSAEQYATSYGEPVLRQCLHDPEPNLGFASNSLNSIQELLQ